MYLLTTWIHLANDMSVYSLTQLLELTRIGTVGCVEGPMNLVRTIFRCYKVSSSLDVAVKLIHAPLLVSFWMPWMPCRIMRGYHGKDRSQYMKGLVIIITSLTLWSRLVNDNGICMWYVYYFAAYVVKLIFTAISPWARVESLWLSVHGSSTQLGVTCWDVLNASFFNLHQFIQLSNKDINACCCIALCLKMSTASHAVSCFSLNIVHDELKTDTLLCGSKSSIRHDYNTIHLLLMFLPNWYINGLCFNI